MIAAARAFLRQYRVIRRWNSRTLALELALRAAIESVKGRI